MKRAIAYGIAATVALCSSAFAQMPNPMIIGPSGTYSTYGNTTYGPGGSTQQQYGNQTYVQRPAIPIVPVMPAVPPTTYQTYGNTTFGSNGTPFQTYGNTTYGNNGTTTQQFGGQTYITGPNGQTRTCQTFGNQTNCN